MIILEWIAIILIISGLCCVSLRCSRVCRLWEQSTLGRYWIAALLIVCTLYVVLAYKHQSVGYVVGLFTPSGLMLGTLIGCYLHKHFSNNSKLMNFKWWDVLFLSSLQLLLMLSSWSVLPWDMYRLGYTPWAALVALFLLAYGYLRNLHVIAIVVVLSLMLWSVGAGSNNYFDWIGHGALLIIAWVWLIWYVLAFLFQNLQTRLKNLQR